MIEKKWFGFGGGDGKRMNPSHDTEQKIVIDDFDLFIFFNYTTVFTVSITTFVTHGSMRKNRLSGGILLHVR